MGVEGQSPTELNEVQPDLVTMGPGDGAYGNADDNREHAESNNLDMLKPPRGQLWS